MSGTCSALVRRCALLLCLVWPAVLLAADSIGNASEQHPHHPHHHHPQHHHQVRRRSSPDGDDRAVENTAVLYQSSRVASTDQASDAGGRSTLVRHHGRRPTYSRRRASSSAAYANSSSPPWLRRSSRVRVHTYIDSDHLADEHERQLFRWTGDGRATPLRRRLPNRARARSCGVSGEGCQDQYLLPVVVDSSLQETGTTYDRRGIKSSPRTLSSTDSSSSRSETQLSQQPGTTVITRYPHRTVYRNATGTYIRQNFGSSPAALSFGSAGALSVPGSRQYNTVFNRSVVTQRRLVSQSGGGSEGLDSGLSTGISNHSSFFTSSSSSSSSGGSGGGGRSVFASTSQPASSFTSSSTHSSSSSSPSNATRRYHTSSFDRLAHSSWSNSSTDGAQVTSASSESYQEHTTAQLREAYVKRNRLEQFGECMCSMLGTDPAAGACQPGSGQCHCLPHVTGRQCDRCQANHWKIALGSGCEPCLCDDIGSVDQQCNEYDGQCRCRDGFGGRRCDQCQDLHWGDPRRQCFTCQCHSLGAASAQCDRQSGACRCRQGVGGRQCDVCARGYRGQAPDCAGCGECFDNWDRVLRELRERTEYLVSEAGLIKRAGAAGIYRAEFDRIEQWLNNIRHILGNATVTDQQVDELQQRIDLARDNLGRWEGSLKQAEAAVDNTTHRLLLAELEVPQLAARASQLSSAATALRDNATQLQEANVDGALTLTREAQRRSKAAEFSVLDTQRTLVEAERQRRRAENLLSRAQQQLNSSQTPGRPLIDRINQQLADFERQMTSINNQVCDGAGAPCDALCGGAGCGKCGGLSCDDGAVTRATNALSVAKDAANILTDRERQVDELLRRVSSAKQAAERALELARATHTRTETSSNSTRQLQQQVEQLLVDIEAFLGNSGATPQAIRDLANQVLNMSISLRPEQISQLAEQINATISSLTNIDAILAETADDLAMAGQLKARADQAKLSAEVILTAAESVMTSLDETAAAQAESQAALTSAVQLTDQADQNLDQLVSQTEQLAGRANKSFVHVLQLQSQHKELLKEFARNELNIKGAVKEAAVAVELSSKAELSVNQLETNYQLAAELLATQTAASSSSRARAQQLLERSNQLMSQTLAQLKQLEDMTVEFGRHEEVLQDMSGEVDALNLRMTTYLQQITDRAEFFRTCQL